MLTHTDSEARICSALERSVWVEPARSHAFEREVEKSFSAF
jgi:hypothetical protein